MFNTLSYIGNKLNNCNIVWAVGASVLLNQYGLVDKPNDIDIIVDINDIDKADVILKSIGDKKVWEKSITFSSRFFYEYTVNGYDVDVISGMRINHSNGIYEYKFNRDAISTTEKIKDVNIPMTSLEDWYVIYQLIPNRESKVMLIEDYLLSNGIKRANLLERALEDNLPKEVEDRIKEILIAKI